MEQGSETVAADPAEDQQKGTKVPDEVSVSNSGYFAAETFQNVGEALRMYSRSSHVLLCSLGLPSGNHRRVMTQGLKLL